jgi:hypothetical protein
MLGPRIVLQLGSVMLLLSVSYSVSTKALYHHSRIREIAAANRQYADPVAHVIKDTGIFDETLYDVEFTSGSIEHPRGEPMIMLVADGESCESCSRASQSWLQVYDVATQAGRVDLRVLSTSAPAQATRLKKKLDERAIAYKVMKPKNARTFGAETGIRGMPMLVIGTPDGEVRCVLRGAPTAKSVEECGSALRHRESPTIVRAGERMTPFLAARREAP